MITLASDVRLGGVNYVDDQIWNLHLRAGDPPGIVIETSYGLRAASMRLSPRFTEGDISISDPGQFVSPPTIQELYPNYARIVYEPFDGVEVIAEYWVPDSNRLGGRIRVINTGVIPRFISMDWIGRLSLAGEGSPLTSIKHELADVLAGTVKDISPVVVISGGAQGHSSPFTCLRLDIHLLPGLEKTLYWAHAGLPNLEDSIAAARELLTRNLDAEFSRIKLTNASQLSITTGSPEWNMAFAYGQKIAYSLLQGPTDSLPFSSLVETRLPDKGYSLRGDGTDYDHLWNGQSVLATWYLCQNLLPASPALAKGLLLNFLKTQSENGFIDIKPGLSGASRGVLAMPLLVDLAKRIELSFGEEDSFEGIAEALLRYVQHWFSPENDEDGDGIPEMSHIMQSGYEENPLFLNWEPWHHGLDISLMESPGLIALLINECEHLLGFKQLSEDPESKDWMQNTIKRLTSALAEMWDDGESAYYYRDHQYHVSSAGKEMGVLKGSGIIRLGRKKISEPSRLIVRLTPDDDAGREVTIRIEGTSIDGETQTETLSPGSIRRSLGQVTAVSKQAYSKVKSVEIEGLHAEDDVVVSTVDYHFHDQTLFLPLFAKAVPAENGSTLIQTHLINPDRYWQPYGIPGCPIPSTSAVSEECVHVSMAWNTLIGEGLIRYGFNDMCAELVSRLMDCVIKNLNDRGSFRRSYNARTGEGFGDRNPVTGLPPLGLFLKTLGVTLHGPWRVSLEGTNPYPWPVRIGFRGTEVIRGVEETTVTFPNRKTITVSNKKDCVVSGRVR